MPHNVDNVHQQTGERMLAYFKFDHLPEKLQNVSQPFAELACSVALDQPSTPERTVCLRKLLEAKDCAVRNMLVLVCLLGFMGSSLAAQAPPVVNVNSKVMFTLSVDDAGVVGYTLEIRPWSDLGRVVFTRNLGHPAALKGSACTVQTTSVPEPCYVSAIGWTAAQLAALPEGDYTAIVQARGAHGATSSSPAPTFRIGPAVPPPTTGAPRATSAPILSPNPVPPPPGQ